jgi:Aspartate/ornithine carbamoyltransferase, carbamoyl-P binding domain
MPSPRHLMTLADLSVKEINHVLHHSLILKHVSKKLHTPLDPTKPGSRALLSVPTQSLAHGTIALLFSKRSTRTRVAAETAALLLGGRALFLGREDIQLGVNETVADSARVLSSMCQGLFARVGAHSEVEVSHLIHVVHIQGSDPTCSRNLRSTQTYPSLTRCLLIGILPKSSLISSRCTKTRTSKTRPRLHNHRILICLLSLLCDLSRSLGWVTPRMSCTICSSPFLGWDIRCE